MIPSAFEATRNWIKRVRAQNPLMGASEGGNHTEGNEETSAESVRAEDMKNNGPASARDLKEDRPDKGLTAEDSKAEQREGINDSGYVELPRADVYMVEPNLRNLTVQMDAKKNQSAHGNVRDANVAATAATTA